MGSNLLKKLCLIQAAEAVKVLLGKLLAGNLEG
jgi:hypothetical protein